MDTSESWWNSLVDFVSDNPVIFWSIVGAIALLIIVAIVVIVGSKRKKAKTVRFGESESDHEVEGDKPKQLTREEKSGNYQASGGFNFAPASPAAAAKQPVTKAEPESLQDSQASDKPQPDTDLSEIDEISEETAQNLENPPHDSAETSSTAGTPRETDSTDITYPAGPSKPAQGQAETADPSRIVDEAEPTGGEADLDDPVDGSESVEEPGKAIESGEANESGDPDSVIDDAEQAAASALVSTEFAEAARQQTPVPETPVEADVEEAEPEQAEREEIAPAAGRLSKLRGRLSKSQNAIGQGLLGLLTAGELDEDAWEEIEDTLIMADLGTNATMKVTDLLRDKIAERGVSSEAEARAMLREALIEVGKPDMDRAIKAMPHEGKPAVVMVVGVNGTGKTTTTGKLGRVLVAMGHKVLFGAADTFRAAAADQLETWGRRVGATTVRGAEGADPASVAFDAVAAGVEQQADVVLVDTAGRLHTSNNLMDQLGKVKRVVQKKADVDEVLLVIDATVGQNGLMQARVFREVVDITGVVLTKLDGTAKGGIVFQVQEELGVPVKLVGLGEGADDLAPFEVESFVDALLGSGK